MSTLLVRNTDILVTMGDDAREIRGGGLFARDGVIEQVGATSDLPKIANDTLDLLSLIHI